jgi:CsoR family transcriptional regulator, copper-sensing transcriptional repressor
MNAEMDKSIQYLKTARGQIDGILKMIDEGRYCVDVSNQIIASQSLLKKANMMVLKQHLNHCVKHAFLHNSGEDKVDEIINLLEKLMEK